VPRKHHLIAARPLKCHLGSTSLYPNMASSQDTVAPEKELPDVVTSGMLPTSSSPSQVSAPEEEQRYSIYTRSEKWFIVAIVAAAGLCRRVPPSSPDSPRWDPGSWQVAPNIACYSPLPANIYFPAIPVMAQAFSTSQEVINQTVTAYLVMQGACKQRFPSV
jgi:hypothetical protein